MPPKKRKADAKSASSSAKRTKTGTSEKVPNDPVLTQGNNALEPLQGVDALSNDPQGALLSLPPKLVDKILKNYPEITVKAPKASQLIPALDEACLEKTRVLRALSQVSRAYRNAFLPLLWDTINICCCHKDDKSFYKSLGDAMVCYANGLDESPYLKPFIRSANLVFTRYKSAEVIPLFARCLGSLPNLQSMQIIHTHSQITAALKNGFEGVTLSSMRTITGPGNIHEILKRCPNITSIWNTSRDSSTLVGVIRNHCCEVQELRDFSIDENTMKRIVKAVPDLQIMGIRALQSKDLIKHLPAFKSFHTVILHRYMNETAEGVQKIEAAIQDFKTAFKKLPPINQKRRIRIYNEPFYARLKPELPLYGIYNQLKGQFYAPPKFEPAFYTEVDMDE